jgi:DNA polymerase III alpha subunit
MEQQTEAELVHAYVDRHHGVHQQTKPDEEQILRELYGEPDPDGVFRGEGA